MSSLEDRARANLAAQQQAAEDQARQARQQAHDAAGQLAKQTDREAPLRARSSASLAEYVQLAKTSGIPAFELRRARVAEIRERRRTQSRMTFDLVAQAWMLSPMAREWGSYSTALAVTADMRIIEFIACLDRLGGGRNQQTFYLIYNECAREFHLGSWFTGTPITEALQSDSDGPLADWVIDPLRGLPRFEWHLKPWDPNDLLRAVLDLAGIDGRDDGSTWSELMAEAAATLMLRGMYRLPEGMGGGDTKRVSE
jgi:hypothetical protein